MRIFRVFAVGLILSFGAASFTGAAWATPLDDAKAAGQVGETPQGLIAAVTANPTGAIVALIADINGRRLAAYQGIATDTGGTVAQVQAQIGQRLIKEAAPGSFILGADGVWRRAP